MCSSGLVMIQGIYTKQKPSVKNVALRITGLTDSLKVVLKWLVIVKHIVLTANPKLCGLRSKSIARALCYVIDFGVFMKTSKEVASHLLDWLINECVCSVHDRITAEAAIALTIDNQRRGANKIEIKPVSKTIDGVINKEKEKLANDVLVKSYLIADDTKKT